MDTVVLTVFPASASTRQDFSLLPAARGGHRGGFACGKGLSELEIKLRPPLGGQQVRGTGRFFTPPSDLRS